MVEVFVSCPQCSATMCRLMSVGMAWNLDNWDATSNLHTTAYSKALQNGRNLGYIMGKRSGILLRMRTGFLWHLLDLYNASLLGGFSWPIHSFSLYVFDGYTLLSSADRTVSLLHTVEGGLISTYWTETIFLTFIFLTTCCIIQDLWSLLCHLGSPVDWKTFHLTSFEWWTRGMFSSIFMNGGPSPLRHLVLIIERMHANKLFMLIMYSWNISVFTAFSSLYSNCSFEM